MIQSTPLTLWHGSVVGPEGRDAAREDDGCRIAPRPGRLRVGPASLLPVDRVGQAHA